jgi:hypothetical protein
MSERFYSGRNSEVLVREGELSQPLDLRLDLDPQGQGHFEWGRENPRGKRLALALLSDALGDDKAAVDLAETFATRVVAILPVRWTMSRARILSHVEIMTRESHDP